MNLRGAIIFGSDLFVNNSISFLRQVGGAETLFVAIHIVKLTVDAVKLIYIILIALNCSSLHISGTHICLFAMVVSR